MTPEQRNRLIETLASGEELSPEWSRILFPPEKREYELVYHGKEREEDIIANTLAVPLQPVRTFNKNGVAWDNKLIFGDNLQAMKRLLEMKRTGELCNADGTPGVRLVYIDPPFATKQEFHGSQEQKAYQDKLAGSRFIEFIRRRLVFLRELLSDDGSLYLHLDQKKAHYIKAIADEVFGEARFRNEIVWQRTNAHNETSQYGRIHDVIFFYTRGSSYVWSPEKVKFSEAQLARYKKDANGRMWTGQDLTAERRGSKSGRFEWRGTMPGDGRGWGYTIEQLEKWWSEGRIAKKRNGTPRMDGLIVYLDRQEGHTPQSIWNDIPRIANTSVERIDYPTQKPEALLCRIVTSSSNAGDIVLDAFGGSGTTCAVAEKLGRRWIGIDCGKLAIYTIQKRLLNLKANIGNKGTLHKAKPFTLYNAGLYDFTRLKDLPWDDWRRFALTLFGCQNEPHRIGGIPFDGTLKSCPVQVFDHRTQPGKTIGEDTLRSIHEAAGSKIGTRMFIIAPAMAFDFQQDYVQIGEVRYYALRVPYSIIHELHHRDFLALKQPTDERAVNDTVDAVGFDFIKTPELEYTVGRGSPDGELLEDAFIRIDSFYSEAAVRWPMRKRGNRETLSMVMLDYDYEVAQVANDVFDLDEVFYAGTIEAAGWEVRFPANRLGLQVMAVFLDIYGNEARVVIPASDFGPANPAIVATQVQSMSGKA